MKLHIKTPKLTKGKLTIVAVSVVVLLLVVLGLAGYQKNQRDIAAQVAADRETSIKADNARKAELNTLNSQITALKADKKSLCDNYTTLSTARATRSLVIVPTACTR